MPAPITAMRTSFIRRSLGRALGRRQAACAQTRAMHAQSAIGRIVVSLITVTVTDELIDCTFGSFDRWSR